MHWPRHTHPMSVLEPCWVCYPSVTPQLLLHCDATDASLRRISRPTAAHRLLQAAKCRRRPAGDRGPPESHSPAEEAAERLTWMTAVPAVSIPERSDATAAPSSLFSLSFLLVQLPPSLSLSEPPQLLIQPPDRVQQRDTADDRVPPAGSRGSEQPLQLQEAEEERGETVSVCPQPTSLRVHVCIDRRTGSYRSARGCQLHGLMKTSSRRRSHDLKRLIQSHPTAQTGL